MLGPEERALLRPLAAALAAAAAGRHARPSLTLVTGDLAGCHLVGLLAGTFNPLTTGHVALAEAARDAGCDRVLLTMAPVSLAKETVERAHALDRLDWLVEWARTRPWVAVAVASHPLLVDMAEAGAALLRELRATEEAGRTPPPRGGRPAHAGGGTRAAWSHEVALVLGADKALQLADPRWYDDPEGAMERLGRAATILVAERAGFTLPALPFPTVPLSTPAWVPTRSATQARAAAAAGGAMTNLVPPEVAAKVLRLGAYAPDPGPYLARIHALQALVDAAT
jgi:nicotinic acid mononucleotide adenylyltransferase